MYRIEAAGSVYLSREGVYSKHDIKTVLSRMVRIKLTQSPNLDISFDSTKSSLRFNGLFPYMVSSYIRVWYNALECLFLLYFKRMYCPCLSPGLKPSANDLVNLYPLNYSWEPSWCVFLQNMVHQSGSCALDLTTQGVHPLVILESLLFLFLF